MSTILPQPIILTLESDDDPAEIERRMLLLRDELLALDVESVEPVAAGPAPAGAKAGTFGAVGSLLVQLAGAEGGVTALIAAVQGWLTRSERSTIKLTIGGDTLELTGATPELQEELAKAWMKKHAGA